MRNTQFTITILARRADSATRRPETWLLLSSKPVDLGRLWRGGWSAVETVNIVYSPVETLKTSAPNQRIATTEEELREMVAACDATRTLIIEDAHPHHDHPHLHSAHHGSQQVKRVGTSAIHSPWAHNPG